MVHAATPPEDVTRDSYIQTPVSTPRHDPFSLEGRVVIITGGARGLGLVMGQGVIHAGADLAIVDLNCTFAPATTTDIITDHGADEEAELQTHQLVAGFKKENPGSSR